MRSGQPARGEARVGARTNTNLLDRSMTMGSNVSFYDERGARAFDGLVREVRVPDSDWRFEATATLPAGPAQDDDPADEGRNHGELAGIIGASSALRLYFDQSRTGAHTRFTTLI